MTLPIAVSGSRLTHPADPIRRYSQSALGSRGAATRSSSVRLLIQYSKLLKSYTLPNEVSGGFKLHNAKTPVMRYVHQPGFPENPREVREFAAPPGLNRGVTAYTSLPNYWPGDNENWSGLNSYPLNDNQNSRHSRALDR